MHGKTDSSPPRGAAWMRMRGMVRKEILQILRDPSSIAIAFVLPIVLLFLFGYGVSLDATDVPVGLVLETSTAATTSFAAEFERNTYFAPRRYESIQAAERALMEGTVQGIVWLRGNFGTELPRGGGPPIGVIVNAVDANNARIIMGYVEGAWGVWVTRYGERLGATAAPPVSLQSRIWYNADMRSRNFLIPGLIAVIMTLIGALLTAMVVAREWERGTMETLIVTPVTAWEILLGKLLPYFVLGMGGLSLSVGMAVWLFDVPLRGSIVVLFSTSALFLLAGLGMGLTISTLARNQFVAGQIAIITTFLPAFILSGFIFDINSMPRPIQVLTHLIAARYYVAILQTVFLAGDVWPVILRNAAALLVMCALFIGIARRHTTKRLD